MQIKDLGIILTKRPKGEKSAIVSALTKGHGIRTFYAQNTSGKNSVIYQPGNLVDIFVNSRLDESMGSGRCELVFGASHFMHDRGKLYALNSLLNMILASFEEGVAHQELYDSVVLYIKGASSVKIMDYFSLELRILSEAGYGLDLSKCVVTGGVEDLKYVSPKSGSAVSKAAGEEYKDKLLALPECLLHYKDEVTKEELEQMADLLLYFFKRYVFKRAEPIARKELMRYIRAS